MAAVDSSIKKKRKFFFFSFQSLNGEGEGAGHACTSPPRGVTTHGPRPAPSTCADRGGKSRACSGGRVEGAAAVREAEGCGAGPGLRDVGGAEQASTFVLTASEARHAKGGCPGLEPGPPGAESALVGAQPVRSRPGSPASSQLAPRLPAREPPR